MRDINKRRDDLLKPKKERGWKRKLQLAEDDDTRIFKIKVIYS